MKASLIFINKFSQNKIKEFKKKKIFDYKYIYFVLLEKNNLLLNFLKKFLYLKMF